MPYLLVLFPSTLTYNRQPYSMRILTDSVISHEDIYGVILSYCKKAGGFKMVENRRMPEFTLPPNF